VRLFRAGRFLGPVRSGTLPIDWAMETPAGGRGSADRRLRRQPCNSSGMTYALQAERAASLRFPESDSERQAGYEAPPPLDEDLLPTGSANRLGCCWKPTAHQRRRWSLTTENGAACRKAMRAILCLPVGPCHRGRHCATDESAIAKTQAAWDLWIFWITPGRCWLQYVFLHDRLNGFGPTADALSETQRNTLHHALLSIGALNHRPAHAPPAVDRRH